MGAEALVIRDAIDNLTRVMHDHNIEAACDLKGLIDSFIAEKGAAELTIDEVSRARAITVTSAKPVAYGDFLMCETVMGTQLIATDRIIRVNASTHLD